jgi:Bacterial SH3 domain
MRGIDGDDLYNPFLMEANCIDDPTTCPQKTRQVGDFVDIEWSADGNLFASCNTMDPYRPCEIDVNSLDITELPIITAWMNLPDGWGWGPWSPDRTKVAFKVDETNSAGNRIGDIYIISTAGGSATNLTNSPDVDDWFDSWSLDGKYVLVSQINGIESTPDKHGAINWYGDIFLYPIDGGKAIQLTHTPDEYEAFAFWMVIPNQFESGGIYQITAAGNNLNMRSSPSLRGAVLKKLNSGDTVTILEGPVQADGYTWWKMRTADGVEGWAVDVAGWYAPVDATLTPTLTPTP